MVRLNKHKLSDQLLNNLFEQLSLVIVKLDHDQTGKFLNELLGPEERVMLAKRLGIVVMLTEGYSMYKVSRTLKVSPTTVQKINHAMSQGAFDNLVSPIKNNKASYKAILIAIDKILTVGGVMPHYGQARIPNK